MSKRGNLYILIFFLAMVLIPLSVMLYYRLMDHLCQYDVVQSLSSEDSEYRYVLYIRKCKLLDSDSMNATILGNGDIIADHRSDIFTVNSRSKSLIVENNNRLLFARWMNANNLYIYYDKEVILENKKDMLEDIKITYIQQ